MGKVLSVVHAWVATLCTITETPVHFNKDDAGTLGGALPEVPLSPSVRALCVSLLSTVFQVYNDLSQLVTDPFLVFNYPEGHGISSIILKELLIYFSVVG